MAFDSSPSLGGRHHLESSAPIIIDEDLDDLDEDEEEPELFGQTHRRSKATESTAEGQKLSAFSRRKTKFKDGSGGGEGKAGKKNRGSRTKASIKTPPDSPKGKGADFSGRGKTGKGSGTALTPQDKSRKGNYATLVDNDFDSDGGGEEEEDADNFLLSKGHLAREKRAGTITRMTPTKEFSPLPSGGIGGEGVVALNPMLFEESQSKAADKGFTTSLPATVGLSSVQAFPVHFAPPTEARFPDPNLESEPFPPFPFEGFTQQKVVSQVLPPPPANNASAPSTVIPSLPPPPSSLSTAQAFAPQPPPLPATTLTSSATSSAPDAPEAVPQASLSPPDWTFTEEFWQKCFNQFSDLQPDGGLLQGEKARKFFVQSRLPMDELSRIWYDVKTCKSVRVVHVQCIPADSD